MHREVIFYPVMLLVAHTFLVWCWMYVLRIRAILVDRVPMSAFRDRQTTAVTPGVPSTASDNLKNLFELPVLFYLGAIVLYQVNAVTESTLLVCWIYVLGRVLHSLVHVSYNNVVHRFAIYMASSSALWVLWIMIAAHLM